MQKLLNRFYTKFGEKAAHGPLDFGVLVLLIVLVIRITLRYG